jgi:hypothetical protein
MASISEEAQYIELIIEPIPPDTISSAKSEILPTIKNALREAGQEQLLDEKQIEVEVEKTFPTDEVIVVGFTLLSGIALATYTGIILPELKRRFKAWQKRRQMVRKLIEK